MSELLSSAVVLGKRKRARRPSELVLHLSGGSRSSQSPGPTVSESEACESEYGQDVVSSGESTSTLKPYIGGQKLVKRYTCAFKGCDKAYKKPSRLREHERSHTGERPFVCSTCSKSYLRESHLQAHARSHMPESARPLVCSVEDCGKRFWTAQHLKVHEDMHMGEKPFKCTHSECHSAYSKHSQLRAHIALEHCPPGTKPFRCEHEGCGKSFSTSQKLKAHVKTHNEKRYTCVHPSCIGQTEKTYFGKWTALQAHMRTAHPVTCPYTSCNGRTFSAQKNLRAHITLHEQREIEEELDCVLDIDSTLQRPKKRRRGGEVGRDWKCDAEGCEKDFKSKKAMTTHYNVTHLQRRDFACTHRDCGLKFGYKHLLQRHYAKVHVQHSSDEAETDIEEERRLMSAEKGQTSNAPWNSIDIITGKGYRDHARQRLEDNKGLRCPFPNISPLIAASPDDAPACSKTHGQGGLECEYVFTRAYDLRRHLRIHGLQIGREKVDEWVRQARLAAV